MEENNLVKSRYLLVILLIIILALTGIYYWVTNRPVTTDVSENDYLPGGVNSSGVTEAVRSIPNTNPYADTNPFENIKTNPFQ